MTPPATTLQGVKPWEIFPYFSYADYQVLRDPQDGLFKCWHVDAALTSANWKSSRSRVLDAESRDGIPWEKPEGQDLSFTRFAMGQVTSRRDGFASLDTGDNVRHKVTWQGRDTIPAAGSFRRIVVHLKNAEIFSFRFEGDKDSHEGPAQDEP